MTQSQAIMPGVAAFVVGFGLCVLLFAALDVKSLFLVGPAIAVGAGAVGAYRAALDDHGAPG